MPPTKTTKSAPTVKTWSAFGTTDSPVARRAPVEVETETDTEALPTAQTGRMNARRLWFCTARRDGCKGQSPFLGWLQLLDRPSCPNCGADMTWHQWGVRV